LWNNEIDTAPKDDQKEEHDDLIFHDNDARVCVWWRNRIVKMNMRVSAVLRKRVSAGAGAGDSERHFCFVFVFVFVFVCLRQELLALLKSLGELPIFYPKKAFQF